MCFRGVRVPFGRARQAALLPFRLAGEGFLGAADVDASGVDFIVALALELIEDAVVRVDGGDARTLFWVGPAGAMSVTCFVV